MTTCEELDILHKQSTHTAVQIATEMVWRVNGRAPREVIAKLGARLDVVLATFAWELHTLLQQEGFDCRYLPPYDGCKGFIDVYLSRTFYHTIVITVHPSHETLIYYNGPPFMGTISELIQRLHDDYMKVLAKGRCCSCHYINTDLWVCGMGRALDAECRDYVGKT